VALTVYTDAETKRFGTGCMAPPLICNVILSNQDPEPYVTDRAETEDWLHWALTNADEIVGLNIAFDMSVYLANYPRLGPLIWQAYRDNRVKDVSIRAMLIAIAADTFNFDPSIPPRGGVPVWSMQQLLLQHLGIDISEDKKSDIRTNFAAYEGVPISEYPDAVYRYVAMDGIYTKALWEHPYFAENVPPDEWLQVRADFALTLASVWGVEVDIDAVDTLRCHLEEIVGKSDDDLIAAGIKQKKPKKSAGGRMYYPSIRKEIQRRIEEACTVGGSRPQRTDPSKTYPEGQIAWSEDAIRLAAEAAGYDDDDPLVVYANTLKASTELSNFVPKLERGILHPRYNVLIRSGRVSCTGGEFGINIQQMPRRYGVRQCFIPRAGWVFIVADYDTAELRALAEVCYEWIGWSKLGEVFKSDRPDPHLWTGSDLLNCTYDEIKAGQKAFKAAAKEHKNVMVLDELFGKDWIWWARNEKSALRTLSQFDLDPALILFGKQCDSMRQLAKALNFGFPGGLSNPATFVDYARKTWGVIVKEQDVPRYREIYLGRYPEMNEYFALVGAKGTPHIVECLRSGRLRGGCRFTNGCNTPFQALTADGAKDALFSASHACYNEPESGLYGSRVWQMVHDELGIETPVGQEEKAKDALESTMRTAMERWITHVPVTVEGKILRDHWEK